MPIKVRLDDNAVQVFYVLLGYLINLLLNSERGVLKSPTVIVHLPLSSVLSAFTSCILKPYFDVYIHLNYVLGKSNP